MTSPRGPSPRGCRARSSRCFSVHALRRISARRRRSSSPGCSSIGGLCRQVDFPVESVTPRSLSNSSCLRIQLRQVAGQSTRRFPFERCQSRQASISWADRVGSIRCLCAAQAWTLARSWIGSSSGASVAPLLAFSFVGWEGGEARALVGVGTGSFGTATSPPSVSSETSETSETSEANFTGTFFEAYPCFFVKLGHVISHWSPRRSADIGETSARRSSNLRATSARPFPVIASSSRSCMVNLSAVLVAYRSIAM